jgi:ribonuclease M5
MNEENGKILLKEVVVVEGKYDKITLSSYLDATIVETNGFGIFKNKEQMALLRLLAKKNGIIVLTDSDKAGFQIRRFISQFIAEGTVKHAYIPDILGKEHRKESPSREGKLGVEGMKRGVILEALKKAGALPGEAPAGEREKIDVSDLYECGLLGRNESKTARRAFLKSLDLPERMSPKALLRVLGEIYSREEFFRAAAKAALNEQGRKGE